jgi:hypothetical protein
LGLNFDNDQITSNNEKTVKTEITVPKEQEKTTQKEKEIQPASPGNPVAEKKSEDPPSAPATNKVSAPNATSESDMTDSKTSIPDEGLSDPKPAPTISQPEIIQTKEVPKPVNEDPEPQAQTSTQELKKPAEIVVVEDPKPTGLTINSDNSKTNDKTILKEEPKSDPVSERDNKIYSASETNQVSSLNLYNYQTTVSNQPEDTKSYGPTSKGTQLLGGSASYRKDGDRYYLTINPNRGAFVANNFAIGFNHLYIARFNSYADYNGFGPYIKLYAGGGDKGKVFTQAGGTIGVNDLKFDNISLGYNLRGGYALFINNIPIGKRNDRFYI